MANPATVLSPPSASAPAGARAVVIGAGFGGIAAALRLRARGYDVTLLDRLDQLGGRAQVYRRNGFVFDAGPTVVTAPFLFEELFELFGKQLADYVDMRPVEPWYRFCFPDGRSFDYGGTVEDTLSEIARFEPRDCDGYLRMVEHSRRIFDKGFVELADQPFGRLRDMLRVVPALARLRSDRSVYRMVSRYLRHPLLRRAFSIQPLLVGGNPFDTTSIYSLIHYLEREWGIHFPMGGTGALVAGLGRLLEEEGVSVALGQGVEEVLVESGRATGVRLQDDSVLPAEVVVANADAPFLYKHMIGARSRRKWNDRRVDRMRYSMGLFVLYFGTTRRYPDVAHHTIVLGERYRELLRDIFDRKVLADDFSLYLHRPTATDPSMAPPGCDAWYVLSPVPNLQSGIDWSEAGPGYRDRIVAALGASVIPGLDSSITEDFYVTPADFRSRYLSLHGAGFSVQPTLAQSAYFRFHNRSEDVENLFLVGAGTHPGAGLPGVLSSAKVLDRIVPATQRPVEGAS
ncbi:MAG: phytoene desaturase family protein [Myxococcota bacterium]|nr:phytoene desaturase family protein [Myxococcota bacterium]